MPEGLLVEEARDPGILLLYLESLTDIGAQIGEVRVDFGGGGVDPDRS